MRCVRLAMNFLKSLLVVFCFVAMGCVKQGGGKNLDYAEPAPLAKEINAQTVALVHPEHFKLEDSEEYMFLPYCTGVWINESMFLTAYHCVDNKGSDAELDAGKVSVHYLSQEQVVSPFEQPRGTYKGRVRFLDRSHDLAIIEAERKRPGHESAKVPDQGAGIGTKMHMVGHVQGFYYTYVEGVVSSYREHLRLIKKTGPFMQVSAPIYYGNSGGGVFNDSGELVGISSFITSAAPNTAFYIPAPVIKHFMRQYKVKN